MTADDKSWQWRLADRTLTIGRRPLIMGILNTTPDSFSDGGQFLETNRAVDHGLEMIAHGADILDVGGESTRPGAAAVNAEDELQRVLPVIESLKQQARIPLSIDTSKAAVARACLQAGASIVNDVTALTGDPEMPAVVAEHNAGAILMHMQGTPRTMQSHPQYDDVVEDVKRYLTERIRALVDAGIAHDQLMIDPGIGFGKTLEHNLQLLRSLGELLALNRPICLGVSRKSFLGKLLNRNVDQRVVGSLTVLCHAMSQSAVQVARVHDVAATRDAVTTWEALV